jgi:hypothetical protein
LFTHAIGLDKLELGEFRAAPAKLGVRGRVFNDLLRAAKQKQAEEEDDDMPQILGDDIPLLSPALGFQRNAALVTVSVTERTKGDRLNTQPYLVTKHAPTRPHRQRADPLSGRRGRGTARPA